jgi:hypothetical protein
MAEQPATDCGTGHCMHGRPKSQCKDCNLDYTDGADADRDKNAIELAAKEVEVHEPKSDLQWKRLVGDVLGIQKRSHSYRNGRFKQQWIAFLKPTAK